MIKFLSVRPRVVNAKVICIGNLVAGGSGKTPFAIALAKKYIKEKKRVAFISRGFGGALSSVKPLAIDSQMHLASDVGDEPLLLAEIAKTYICTNRYLAAKLAVDEGAEIIIMDDGFQNQSLHKDISILLYYTFGNKLLLPAGPMREPISHGVERADFIYYYDQPIENIERNQRKINVSYHIDSEIKKCISLTGIANPERFYEAISSLGIEIMEKFEFPDHHQFSKLEIDTVIEAAINRNLNIVTTHKDLIRLKNQVDTSLFLVIDIKIEIPNCIFQADL